ncbi:MAG: hypothetical protein LBT59_11420 [Clostridiales bacterium]|nr:hypothetical protein [Clostridiales bacterium]
MDRLKLYINSVLGKKTIKRFAIYESVKWIILVLASYFLSCFFYSLDDTRRPFMNLAFLFLGIVLCVAKLRESIFANEISFLKKLGFADNEILIKCLFNFKNIFYAASVYYAVSFQKTLSLYSVLACIAGALLAFCSILAISYIYVCIVASLRKSRIIINVALIAGLAVALATAIIYVYRNNIAPSTETLVLVVAYISESAVSSAISLVFFDSITWLSLAASVLIAIFFLGFKSKVLYLEEWSVNITARVRKSKATVQSLSMFKAFLLRDMRSLYTDAVFMLMQIVFLVIGIWISSSVATEDLFGLCALVCWLNSFNIYTLFLIDGKFEWIYKMLPLRFSKFMLMRGVCVLTYTAVVPSIILGVAVFNGLSALYALGLLIALMAMVAIIYIISSGILLMFYPNIEKSELCFLLGNFLIFTPLLPVALVCAFLVGMKTGSRKWEVQ